MTHKLHQFLNRAYANNWKIQEIILYANDEAPELRDEILSLTCAELVQKIAALRLYTKPRTLHHADLLNPHGDS